MKPKLASLDAVRAAACIGILSFHMYLTYLGVWGVTVFFVLSAFLMSYNYLERPVFEKPSVKEGLWFSLKRTAKLYPLHLLTLAFPLLLQVFSILTGRMAAEGAYGWKLALNVLLLHSLCPPQSWYFSFNSVSWYLSSIMIIYLFFPLILRCIRRYNSVKNAWLAMVLTLILQALTVWFLSRLIKLDGFSNWLGYICPFIRLGDYIVGCNLAYIFLHRGESRLTVRKATILELLAIVCCIATELLRNRSFFPRSIKNSTAFIPAVALLIWCFACGEGKISRSLTGRVTHCIADLSSYVFLIHPVVIQFTSIVLDRLPMDYQLKRWCFLLIVPTLSFTLAILYRNFHKKRHPICHLSKGVSH